MTINGTPGTPTEGSVGTPTEGSVGTPTEGSAITSGELLNMTLAELKAHGYERTATGVRKRIDSAMQLDITATAILKRAGISAKIDDINREYNLGENSIVMGLSIDLETTLEDDTLLLITGKNKDGDHVEITFVVTYHTKDGQELDTFNNYDSSSLASTKISHRNTVLYRSNGSDESTPEIIS